MGFVYDDCKRKCKCMCMSGKNLTIFDRVSDKSHDNMTLTIIIEYK